MCLYAVEVPVLQCEIRAELVGFFVPLQPPTVEKHPTQHLWKPGVKHL